MTRILRIWIRDIEGATAHQPSPRTKSIDTGYCSGRTSNFTAVAGVIALTLFAVEAQHLRYIYQNIVSIPMLRAMLKQDLVIYVKV
jgi:hypothetical protein